METYQHVMIKWLPNVNNAGPILESKGMYAIFQKKGKTNSKKGQVRQNQKTRQIKNKAKSKTRK